MHAKSMMKSVTDTVNGGEICISRIQTTFTEKLAFWRILFSVLFEEIVAKLFQNITAIFSVAETCLKTQVT